jgi:hypothetical protein
MKLICDDFNQVYVWVDENDENNELSPHFDYEDDAEKWYKDMKKRMLSDHMFKGLGL